jgi:hypothetical protein
MIHKMNSRIGRCCINLKNQGLRMLIDLGIEIVKGSDHSDSAP